MLNLLKSCQLCPRRCKVNRLNGEKGFCKAGKDITIYNYHLHLGEEPPIKGERGSGTIFFTYCNSKCVYCQNYKFSQLHEGKNITIDELSEIMVALQNKGAHNINLVTPTHFVPQIIEAINIAKGKGLSVPIVYNTNGYETQETLQMLQGIIDIYLPDMRYSSNEKADKYSSISQYVIYNRMAVKIMYEQVGDLVIENGLAKKGLIIRHLVLPNNIAGTDETMQFIKDKLSTNTYISLMEQFHPVYRSNEYPELNRKITDTEYEEAINLVWESGLKNGWCQERHTKNEHIRYLGVNFSSDI